MILLSHSHLDHLSLGSLGMLEEKFPKCDMVFPSGLEEFLPGFNFRLHRLKRADSDKKVYIGETKQINGIKITTVAAYHWGGRYGLDGLLWGYDAYAGFIIQYKDVTVYFTGDTGYDKDFFKFLGENYSIDLALVPIGPCKDCRKLHKKNRHVYPKGALKILDDTKSKMMIPIHYGTVIELSEPNEPRRVLEDLIRGNDKYKEKVKILKIGEQILIN
jgi:L-ascorbate metabolism protein UlaG (beta-lactamase superfamily)